MTTFLDIADETRTVAIGSAEVPVSGLSADAIARLFRRYPDVQTVLFGGGIPVDTIAEVGPAAIAAIVASGLGYPDSPEAEAKAGRLPLHLQVKILRDVMDMTWPGALDPLVEKLEGIAAGYRSAIAKSSSGDSEPERATTRSRSSRRRSKS